MLTFLLWALPIFDVAAHGQEDALQASAKAVPRFDFEPPAPGTYKLQFDMAGYPDAKAVPFFPEIDPVFRVTDPAAHYHVPVVVSPFGYSTYRDN